MCADGMLGEPGLGSVLLANRVHNSVAMRNALAVRGAWAGLKALPDWKRLMAFIPSPYRYRNFVGHLFNKIRYF